MSIANTAQAEHWNSGEDAAYWTGNQERFDRMLEPFTDLILSAAAPRQGGHVLDVGCGCGATTLAAARLVMPGEAVGIDLSAPMLTLARAGADAAGLANAVFVQGDAQVHRLGPARFDAVISRFGVMFFDDPAAAFTNIRSATRPGGRLVFICWQPLAANEWLLVPRAALAEHVPAPAPEPGDGPGMFAFADPDRLRRILFEAGWRDIAITPEHTPILVGGGRSVEDAVGFLRTGSMARTMLAGADADTADSAVASLRSALAEHANAEGVHLGAAVWLVQAVAP